MSEDNLNYEYSNSPDIIVIQCTHLFICDTFFIKHTEVLVLLLNNFKIHVKL